jgi:hypothetical protein
MYVQVEEYAATLSQASAYTLTVLDDEAKDPQAPVPAFGHFRPLLARLVRP